MASVYRQSGRKRAKGIDKVSRTLQARIHGYEEACRIADKRIPGSSKQYRVPGSRKKAD